MRNLLIVLFLSVSFLCGAQGNDCMPFTDCWCEDHPDHKFCQEDEEEPEPETPIDGEGLIYLAMVGILLAAGRKYMK